MTRLEALEKVAEVAQKWADAKSASWVARGLLKGEAAALYAAVANLRALPPAPAAETVTLAVWKNVLGSVTFTIPVALPSNSANTNWTYFGTVTLPLDKEPGHAE